jgi:hypothetical protein
MADTVHVADQLVFGKKGLVAEVMRFQPPHAQGHRFTTELLLDVGVGQQIDDAALVTAPGTGGCDTGGHIGAKQLFTKTLEQVTPVGLGNGRHKACVRVREHPADAVEKPVNLCRCAQENTAQDKAGAAHGVGLSIGQRQSGAPGAAEHQPLFHVQQGADALDVLDQQLRGVVTGLAQGYGLASTTLVKQHNAVIRRVKELPVPG